MTFPLHNWNCILKGIRRKHLAKVKMAFPLLEVKSMAEQRGVTWRWTSLLIKGILI